MTALMRCCLIALAVSAAGLTAADKAAPALPALTMDDLYGRWQPDVAAMDAKLKQDAAAAITKDAEWSLTLTPKVGRLVRGDEMLSGMWRLDDAAAKGGTIVIEPKGGEAHRFAFTYDGKHLFITELPWKIPFAKQK